VVGLMALPSIHPHRPLMHACIGWRHSLCDAHVSPMLRSECEHTFRPGHSSHSRPIKISG
jgi:hypothetical protein